MSGSPIIQDEKLVGAVTHVLVDDIRRELYSEMKRSGIELLHGVIIVDSSWLGRSELTLRCSNMNTLGLWEQLQNPNFKGVEFASWILPELTAAQISYTYASETDMLNVGMKLLHELAVQQMATMSTLDLKK